MWRQDLAGRLAERLDTTVSAALRLSGSIALPDGSARVARVQVLGVDDAFWSLSPGGGPPLSPWPKNGVALSERAAARLGASVGDAVIVRAERPAPFSRDAPMASDARRNGAGRRRGGGRARRASVRHLRAGDRPAATGQRVPVHRGPPGRGRPAGPGQYPSRRVGRGRPREGRRGRDGHLAPRRRGALAASPRGRAWLGAPLAARVPRPGGGRCGAGVRGSVGRPDLAGQRRRGSRSTHALLVGGGAAARTRPPSRRPAGRRDRRERLAREGPRGPRGRHGHPRVLRAGRGATPRGADGDVSHPARRTARGRGGGPRAHARVAGAERPPRAAATGTRASPSTSAASATRTRRTGTSTGARRRRSSASPRGRGCGRTASAR